MIIIEQPEHESNDNSFYVRASDASCFHMKYMNFSEEITNFLSNFSNMIFRTIVQLINSQESTFVRVAENLCIF